MRLPKTLKITDDTNAQQAKTSMDNSNNVDNVANIVLTKRIAVRHLLPVIKLVLLLIPIVLLRVIYLDSDAYPRLSWSSALLTDEGFYIHNARNLVLFGHERTDDFNNALLMPLLHFIQVIVFRWAGVGAVQARSISIALSLMTLLVFFAALRRAFGTRVAWLGVLLLGLDPVFVLYNRLALMDTPACFPLCAAFYAWVRGGEVRGEVNRDNRGNINSAADQQNMVPRHTSINFQSKILSDLVSSRLVSSRYVWLFISGLCLGVAYVVRGLAIIAVASPLLILLIQMAQAVKDLRNTTASHLPLLQKVRKVRLVFAPLAAFSAGLIFILTLYLIFWYLPHRAELAFLNKYYVQEQLLPHSLYRLRKDVVDAFVHPYRGVFPYLFKHSPLLLLLGGLPIIGNLIVGLRLAERCKQFRSYVNTYREYKDECKEEIAEIVEIDEGVTKLSSRSLFKTLLRALPDEREQHPFYWAQSFLMGWVTIYLVFVCIVDYAPSRYYILFYPALAALAAVGLDRAANFRVALPVSLSKWFSKWMPNNIPKMSPVLLKALAYHQIITIVLCLWGGINFYWYADWLSTMTYRQRDADAWLATHLPPDSVLIGAAAPGLCLNNHFRCVNMIDHLCNYNRPVERFAPSPRYIVMLDQEAYYLENLKKQRIKKIVSSENGPQYEVFEKLYKKANKSKKNVVSVQLAWANRWREQWWATHYAEIVKPERRLHAFPKLIRPFFTVGIYAVPFDYDFITSYYEKMAGVRKEF